MWLKDYLGFVGIECKAPALLRVQVIEDDERGSAMRSVTSSWRQRRLAARNQRALDRAMAGANTPAMREELYTLARVGPAGIR